jgi:hypothetical protein
MKDEEEEEEEEDDEIAAHEKMQNRCSSGKKTQVTLTELYGFFMWIMTALGYFGYQFWAYVPDYIIQGLGINYIPNKYMAVAIPAWICITVWCVIMLYLSYSMMHTHNRNSYFTMQDRHSALAHPRDIDPPPTVPKLKLGDKSTSVTFGKKIAYSAKHRVENDSLSSKRNDQSMSTQDFI